ncbi:MAG: hypothetical protein ACMUJM_16575 [bacterium]
MVKSNNSISQHLRGKKGNMLTYQVQRKNLEHVMVIPIEIGKSYNKALIANYFVSLLKEPFEFHNSQEGCQHLYNTISSIYKSQPVEEILIGMEATDHYYKMPASSLSAMGYNNLFILNPLSTSHCRKAELTWFKTADFPKESIFEFLIDNPDLFYILSDYSHHIIDLIILY